MKIYPITKTTKRITLDTIQKAQRHAKKEANQIRKSDIASVIDDFETRAESMDAETYKFGREYLSQLYRIY